MLVELITVEFYWLTKEWIVTVVSLKWMRNLAHYIKDFLHSLFTDFHFLIHRDSSENRDLRLSRRFFLLIKLSSSFFVTSIWSYQNRIFIFKFIDFSTISKINKFEKNHLDWMIVKRFDAKSTNWWRIDDTNRFK
jgi:hypothetical protein